MDQLKIRGAQKVQSETVLVMQGGGSLGAYECEVYKTLAKRGIKFDIIAGTSIGAINAAIIVGSKNDAEPAAQLEDFWLNVAEKITLSNSDTRPRLVITSTDIQKRESVTFDSKFMSIDTDHIIACAGFPFYGIAWTEKDGRYLWDGSLQSNTPFREVIDASPKYDKNVYIPRIQKKLPENMLDS